MRRHDTPENHIQHHLDIPVKLPRMNYRFSAGTKGNRGRSIIVQYENGKEFDQSLLMNLRQNIFGTTQDYVHPMVYVDFAKENVYKSRSDRIEFDKEHMLELRYLSNDLRNKAPEMKDDMINYLVYVIACRIVAYAKVVRKIL